MGLLERRFRAMTPGAEAPAERRQSIGAQSRSIRLPEALPLERRGHTGRVVELSDVRRDAIRKHRIELSYREIVKTGFAAPIDSGRKGRSSASRISRSSFVSSEPTIGAWISCTAACSGPPDARSAP